jgi:UDPglucose 6-dehydrogenase
MKVCVQGLWHLGSVTAACLASIGHEVVGLDRNSKVIENLNIGLPPIFEPGLEKLISRGLKEGQLRFSTSPEEALRGAQILWVTLDTPVDDDDNADIDFVINEIKHSLGLIESGCMVLISSQLPVGSINNLSEYALKNFPDKVINFACSPENLRLGKAIEIFLDPDRIIVGVSKEVDKLILERLISPITSKIEWMSIESAEMTKHAINAFLATSVVFINEIAAVCELVGADAKEVERGLKSEVRIGPKAYLSPGGPFAGGTLARDVRFLNEISHLNKLTTPLISSVIKSNSEHKYWAKRMFAERFTKLTGLTVGIWGLTYKPGTDTLRRSLAIELCNWLLGEGASLRVFDPVVKKLPKEWLDKVVWCQDAIEAVKGADVLLVGTEWPEFKIAASKLKDVIPPHFVVIDANRHLYQSLFLASCEYVSVGSSNKVNMVTDE